MGLRPGRIGAVVAAAFVVGLLRNALGGRGLPVTRNAFVEPGDAAVEIEAKDAKKRLDEGALFLDARPVDFYKMSHIPGPLSLPEDDFNRAYARLEQTLPTRF